MSAQVGFALEYTSTDNYQTKFDFHHSRVKLFKPHIRAYLAAIILSDASILHVCLENYDTAYRT